MAMIPNAKKTILPGGIRLLTEEIPSMRSAAMGIMFGTGSGSETPENAGISHYIEHMMFKGTKKRTAFEIAHALDSVGGKMNAYTSKEATMYYAVILDKHIDVAIDVLCDMVANSVYDEKEMEVEKGVILEEIKMYEDTPDELIHDYFAEQILSGHPLGQPTIGHAKSVKATKREHIIQYLQEYYSPRNMIISLAGAIPDNLEARILPYFSSFAGKPANFNRAVPSMRGSINLKQKKTEQVHLCLGTRGPSQLDEERYTFTILENILGGSMSSRLFQEVREKRGLAYSIFTTTSPFRNFGIAYSYAGTSKENLEQVVEIILREMRGVKKSGLTEEEIGRGRENLKGSLVLGLESTSSRMSWLAKTEFFHNRVISIDEIFDKIDRVKNDDIIAAANRYFCDEYLTLAVIGDLDQLPIKTLKL